MVSLKKENIDDFYNNGWTLVNMSLSKEEIKYYLKGTENLKNSALKNNYPLKRCYFPHLRNDNIASIESPFNKLIVNQAVKELFQKIELGKTIKELLGWKSVYLHLARLFTMSKYKYLGKWHRDTYSWNGIIKDIKAVQVAIYLKDQDGFRIFKPSRDIWSKDKRSITKELPIYTNKHMPLKIDSSYYDEIKGKAGTILFFVPGFLHQGNSSVDRLDFHMRFSSSKFIEGFSLPNKKIKFFPENSFFDFKMPEFYTEDFDINQDLYSPRMQTYKPITRILNSINYQTSCINLARFMKRGFRKKPDKNEPWELDIFANTKFQK